jgi:hypothetical protein
MELKLFVGSGSEISLRNCNILDLIGSGFQIRITKPISGVVV